MLDWGSGPNTSSGRLACGHDGGMTSHSPPIRKTVEFTDPAATAQVGATMPGLDFLRGMATGAVPAPPIAVLMNMGITAVEEGRVVFTGTPDTSHYNPIGVVHGGFAATMLDTVAGCAVHTTLPAGTGYSSIEIKVSFLRPIQAGVRLVATGTVTKPGSRVCFADGTLADENGRLVATASSSVLIFQPPAR